MDLLRKLKVSLPLSFYKVLGSYLSKRYFEIKYKDELPTTQEVSMALYYTADVSTSTIRTTVTFLSTTALLAINSNPTIQFWLKSGKLKLIMLILYM